MEVSQKRKLLEAIDTLIRRPAQANERTLVEAMAYFKLLVEEVAQGEITVTYIDTTNPNNPMPF
ncbi:hypothetical protein [Acinetobacter sp. F9]|uniref:hypothetical protein n=1 Tax=Acinetobacter sp. F9 TaxID=2853158 RepID=UPI001C462E5C|nr:hypothetical protein [Acinetobacter sp. F9]